MGKDERPFHQHAQGFWSTPFQRKHVEHSLQQEMCRLMSTEYHTNEHEVSAFLAVMNMIKATYDCTIPEVYKMLLMLLHDFNPKLGQEHRNKLCHYISVLLQRDPELADLLISILPNNTNRDVDVLQRLPIGCNRLLPSELDLPNKAKKDVKFFNFTTPDVNAFMAKQGVPSKITTADAALNANGIPNACVQSGASSSSSQYTPIPNPIPNLTPVLNPKPALPAVPTMTMTLTIPGRPVPSFLIRTDDNDVDDGKTSTPKAKPPVSQYQTMSAHDVQKHKLLEKQRKLLQQVEELRRQHKITGKPITIGSGTHTRMVVPTRYTLSPRSIANKHCRIRSKGLLSTGFQHRSQFPVQLGEAGGSSNSMGAFPYGQQVTLADGQRQKYVVCNGEQQQHVKPSTSATVSPLFCLQKMVNGNTTKQAAEQSQPNPYIVVVPPAKPRTPAVANTMQQEMSYPQAAAGRDIKDSGQEGANSHMNGSKMLAGENNSNQTQSQPVGVVLDAGYSGDVGDILGSSAGVDRTGSFLNRLTAQHSPPDCSDPWNIQHGSRKRHRGSSSRQKRKRNN